MQTHSFTADLKTTVTSTAERLPGCLSARMASSGTGTVLDDR